MVASVCGVCGGNKVEHDSASGSSFCVICGAVLEESTIVSELTFGETDGGQAILHGQFVSEKGTVGHIYGAGGHHSRRYNATESREITLANARQRIQQIAAAINLSEQYVDMAHRWFILALQHRFTRGRKGTSVSAACLYIVCRQEKTSHMLLDFSEILRINVYALGNIFLKLVRVLNLELPLVDPSLYMGRFAAKLEFGEKTQLVANTALRIASRMKRDWIVTGRRPNGVCGACLLVSCRMYGFQRTQLEIVTVVKVCETTVRKRLYEFAELPSSKLTPQEFHTIWLEQEADPPIFTKHRLAEKKAAEEAAVSVKSGKRLAKRSKKIHSIDELTPESDNESDQEAPTQPIVGTYETKASEESASSSDDNLLVEMKNLLDSEDLLKAETLVRNDPATHGAQEPDVSLSDLDDDEEVLNSLLSTDELDLKSKIWHLLNGEFMAELQVKQAQKAQLEDDANAAALNDASKPQRKKRSERSKSNTLGVAQKLIADSAFEAAMNVVDAKKLSKKINYTAMDDLFEGKKGR